MANLYSKLTLLMTIVLASIRLLAVVPLTVVTDRSVGLQILGGIYNEKDDNPRNTVLLKNLKDNSVKAWKLGQTIEVPQIGPQVLEAASKKYMIVKSSSNKSITKVIKDGFDADEQKKIEQPEIEKPSIWTQERYKEDGFEREMGTVKMSKGYREQMMVELPKILMQASAEPVIRGGEIIGFEMSEIEKNSLYEKAGVQNGDIITSINDRPLDDASRTVALLNSLRKADHVDLKILRNGQEIPLTLDVTP